MAACSSNSKLFAEYIGANDKRVTFSDVPIVDESVPFHFILSFAIDYTNPPKPEPPNSDDPKPEPTNGEFQIFWDKERLTPQEVEIIKKKHSNVKVALSIGGATVKNTGVGVMFSPTSPESWLNNAVTSLKKIIKDYHLDGIDINYEKFNTEVQIETFTNCIGGLIKTLKEDGVIEFASIAPYVDPGRSILEEMYKALWRAHYPLIDYVNFQFYAKHNQTTVQQYLKYYDDQLVNYPGGKVLASLQTGDNTALEYVVPANVALQSIKELKEKGKLYGIFIWAADRSHEINCFYYEEESQKLLAAHP